MNETESDLSLRDDLQSLQTLFSVSLVLILVFTLCVDLFMFRQVFILRAQAHKVEAELNGFTATTGPAIIKLYSQLSDYGAKHPEYAAIIKKYSPFFDSHITRSK